MAFDYHGKYWAVIGMGASGLAAARFLETRGARVYKYDEKKAGADVLHDANDVPWETLHGAVFSPGIPYDHSTFVSARAAATPIYSDLDLLLQKYPHVPIVAVTGTNGKSTTTALVAHILKAAGYEAVAAGNIGLPAAGVEFKHPENAALVLECSSFQLELSRCLKPKAAIWLNITPDHIDRHGDIEGYVTAKRRMFRLQDERDVAIIGSADHWSDETAEILKARENGPEIVRIASSFVPEHGMACSDDGFYEDGNFTPLTPCALAAGLHMRENAAAAYAACRKAFNIDPHVVAAACAGFAPLPHRMEHAARKGNVLFVNDSKATNADSASQALKAFPGCYWIAGGKPKQDGLASMTHMFKYVKRAYCIGSAEIQFAETLEAYDIPARRCGTLAAAFQAVIDDIRCLDGGFYGAPKTVLFSPACASFDQWKNFEERGDAFRDMAQHEACKQEEKNEIEAAS